MDPLPFPCLALYEGANTPKPTFFDIFEEAMIECAIDSLTNNKKKLWSTPQGWILVRDAAAAATFLQNPRDSGDKIHLPHLPEDLPSKSTCVLSGKPTIPGCVALLVEPFATVIWYLHVGEEDGEWTRHEYDIGTQRLDPPIDGEDHEKVPICSIAACRGKFYFNGGLSDIGVLEFSPSAAAASPVFSSLELAGEFEVVYRAKVFLVESGEDLYMVMLVYHSFRCDKTDYETRVYRMDFSEQPPRWRAAGDLAGGAFLLSPWYFGATCSAAELGLHEDCVYAFVPGDDEVPTCLKMSSVKDGWDDFVDVPAAHRALWMPTDS
uniref:KIB1-4 beta-propeller domain-containing protein n=1 Tax=Oryza barthii TaxID=65489 RepID=A0A0D3FPR9_9ORYZ